MRPAARSSVDPGGGACDAADLARIDEVMPPGAAAGERYDAIGMSVADA